MSLFERTFVVTDWTGRTHKFTASDLYERIAEDSKSDYNWLASASELVRVCSQKHFPEKYAVAIKLMILNCFANLELQREVASRGEATDQEAVYFCFHSLPAENETVKKVKEKYICNIIRAVPQYTSHQFFHHGPMYKKVCIDWVQEQIVEYVNARDINLNTIRETLKRKFEATIRSAEDLGAFEADDHKYEEELRNFWASINLKDL